MQQVPHVLSDIRWGRDIIMFGLCNFNSVETTVQHSVKPLLTAAGVIMCGVLMFCGAGFIGWEVRCSFV